MPDQTPPRSITREERQAEYRKIARQAGIDLWHDRRRPGNPPANRTPPKDHDHGNH